MLSPDSANIRTVNIVGRDTFVSTSAGMLTVEEIYFARSKGQNVEIYSVSSETKDTLSYSGNKNMLYVSCGVGPSIVCDTSHRVFSFCSSKIPTFVSAKDLTTDHFVGTYVGSDIWPTTEGYHYIRQGSLRKKFKLSIYLSRILGLLCAKYLSAERRDDVDSYYKLYKKDMLQFNRTFGMEYIQLFGITDSDFWVPQVIRVATKTMFENFLYGFLSYGDICCRGKSNFLRQLQLMLFNYGIESNLLCVNDVYMLKIGVATIRDHSMFPNMCITAKERTIERLNLAHDLMIGDDNKQQYYRGNILWNKVSSVSYTGKFNASYSFSGILDFFPCGGFVSKANNQPV